jgi:pimeloyl-ACP methyl ester carboxylesterase
MQALRLVGMAVALTAIATSASAQDQLGVVLLHGKQSAPEQHAPLTEAVAAAGFLIERPEMCWSRRRIYDRPYLECLRDIDAAIERLKTRGATSIVIAGHSLGANAALAYGARNPVRGVVALAPGHAPEVLARRPQIARELDRARALLAAGQDNERLPFADFNGGLQITVFATPAAYVSFFAPDSAAVMPTNAAQLRAPLLLVAGSDDPLQRGPDYIFAHAPSQPGNRYAVVQAGHFDTSAASTSIVTEWLAGLSHR